MACLNGEEPAPPELSLAMQCERWRCLPEAGAFLDQDHTLMTRMAACSNVYAVLSRYRNAKGRQIHNLSGADRRVLRLLLDMGISINAGS